MVTLRASRNRISDSYTLVSERVFERSVIDGVFCGSGLTASELQLLQLQRSVTAVHSYVGHYNLWRLLHMSTCCSRGAPSINFTSGGKASCQKLFNDVFLAAPTVTEASFRPRYTI